MWNCEGRETTRGFHQDSLKRRVTSWISDKVILPLQIRRLQDNIKLLYFVRFGCGVSFHSISTVFVKKYLLAQL